MWRYLLWWLLVNNAKSSCFFRHGICKNMLGELICRDIGRNEVLLVLAFFSCTKNKSTWHECRIYFARKLRSFNMLACLMMEICDSMIIYFAVICWGLALVPEMAANCSPSWTTHCTRSILYYRGSRAYSLSDLFNLAAIKDTSEYHSYWSLWNCTTASIFVTGEHTCQNPTRISISDLLIAVS